jgi:hypothetical protein
MSLSKLQKLSLTKLRGLVKQAAFKVEFLDIQEPRSQEAIDIAAKELAYIVSIIDYKIANKRNKKFAY